MSAERKTQLLQRICRSDFSAAEWGRITAPKGRGLKKSFIVLGGWQCLLDEMKSCLMGASRASDTAVPMIALMNGLRNDTVYNLATVLSDRINDFFTLKHKAFYMPFHAIGLFLNAIRT